MTSHHLTDIWLPLWCCGQLLHRDHPRIGPKRPSVTCSWALTWIWPCSCFWLCWKLRGRPHRDAHSIKKASLLLSKNRAHKILSCEATVGFRNCLAAVTPNAPHLWADLVEAFQISLLAALCFLGQHLKLLWWIVKCVLTQITAFIRH